MDGKKIVCVSEMTRSFEGTIRVSWEDDLDPELLERTLSLIDTS